MGMRYLRHVIITWSMRRRGSVQRTHIMTKTRNQPFNRKTNTLMTLPTMKPKLPGSPKRSDNSSTNGSPRLQPPRNMMLAMPLTANMLPYSAMKITSQRNPEYSV